MQECKSQNPVLKMQDKHRHSGWVWWPLWIAVLFSGYNTALQPTSHKNHRPCHFLLTFIPPLIPLSPAALFYLCLPHYLSFSAPLFHPPYFFFCHSTQLNSSPFLASPWHLVCNLTGQCFVQKWWTANMFIYFLINLFLLGSLHARDQS